MWIGSVINIIENMWIKDKTSKSFLVVNKVNGIRYRINRILLLNLNL